MLNPETSVPDGALAHSGSWIALAIVVTAVATAWLLNHRAPQARASGTLLAALCCLGVVAWFAAALGTGVIADPKPFQMPMDAAKPALLWLQASIALVGGLVLLAVAYRQRSSVDVLDLKNSNEEGRYGRVSRVLHWTTAILFIAMIPMGTFASMLPDGVWMRKEYMVVHKTIGIIVVGLLFARLLWNRRSRRPALDAALKPMERKLAHAAHVMLYILMFAVPVTGYMMTSLHGYPSYLFGLEIQPLLAESETYRYWGLFHKYLLPYLVYLILGAHVLGALKHHYVDRHASAFKRMVS